jgi:hypothetical protein
MEWGINTAELQNLRNLTPAVFRQEREGVWYVKYDMEFPVSGATLPNSKYCLDRAIAIILKKQEHRRTTRYRKRGEQFDPPSAYLGDNVYKRASVASEVVHVVSEHFEYTIREVVSGFSPEHVFYGLTGATKERDEKGWPKEGISGFLLIRPNTKG